MAEIDRGIAALLEELESLCARAERELGALRWDDVQQTIADQRRVRQALVNSIEASQGRRDAEGDAAILQRIKRIYAYRDGQLKRMIAYRDKVRSRLSVIARAKRAGRSLGAHARAKSAGLDLLR